MIRFYIVPDMLANAPMSVSSVISAAAAVAAVGEASLTSTSTFFHAGSSELAKDAVSEQREEEQPFNVHKVSSKRLHTHSLALANGLLSPLQIDEPVVVEVVECVVNKLHLEDVYTASEDATSKVEIVNLDVFVWKDCRVKAAIE